MFDSYCLSLVDREQKNIDFLFDVTASARQESGYSFTLPCLAIDCLSILIPRYLDTLGVPIGKKKTKQNETEQQFSRTLFDTFKAWSQTRLTGACGGFDVERV